MSKEQKIITCIVVLAAIITLYIARAGRTEVLAHATVERFDTCIADYVRERPDYNAGDVYRLCGLPGPYEGNP